MALRRRAVSGGAGPDRHFDDAGAASVRHYPHRGDGHRHDDRGAGNPAAGWWPLVWAALGIVAVLYVQLVEKGIIQYGKGRIDTWRDPFNEAWFHGDGWQISQSLIAIGSGGLLGVGLGKSRQKFLYLPEEHNDFIFAIVCEELGLIGATVIMLLFAALILRGFWIALHARDRFGSLMVVGVMTLVGLQTFLNIGVVTGLLPTTGISLPFFQLWRHGAVHPAGGDGHRPVGIPADEPTKAG